SYGRNKLPAQVYRGFWRKFDQTENFPELAGENLKVFFNFKTIDNERVKIKFSISPVSTQGAINNIQEEVPHWDFEKVKSQTQEQWKYELNSMQIIPLDQDEMIDFYTAVCHAVLGPTVYMDVDGKYRCLDRNIYQAEDFVNYTSFSLWDTYRVLHPLFNVIQPRRNADMITSMLEHQKQSVHGMLPIWSHYANEKWCMIGYHSVSVIADAIVKGNTGFDLDAALLASVETAKVPYYDGLDYYMDLGYVPEDKNGASVSKTLEYAYDDWAIAQAANALGNTSVYEEFAQRSENYKNVFDTISGFMRPKLSDGSFKKEFDPMDTHGQGFIEGNSWNYSLYVPHQPDTMIAMMGGKDAFVNRLDSLFTMELPDKY